MQARLDYRAASPRGFAAMAHLSNFVERCGLEAPLLELVKMRASQINGCAFCLDMHSKDAVAGGEDPQRLYTLPAWRETPFFSDRERAALAWTEAVTEIAVAHIDDALFAEMRRHFSERELVDLTLAVVTINGWNRLAIPFRSEVGGYQPGGDRRAPDE